MPNVLDLGLKTRTFQLGEHRVIGADLSALDPDTRVELFAKTASDVIAQPLLTSAIVLGQQQKRSQFPDFVAPPLMVDKVKVEFPNWTDDKWMERKETLRTESAEYGVSRTKPTTKTTDLERHSWATMTDQRVLNNADAIFRIAEKYSGFSARIVRKSFEYEVADLIQQTGTSVYATGHVTTLGAGNEFDAATPANTPREVVFAIVATICNAVGCEPRDLRILMSLSTRNALVLNSDFQTWNRGDTARQDDPDEGGAFARYFGVGGAMVENPWGMDSSGTGPLLSDRLFVFLPGVGGEYDKEFGERSWLAQWRMNAGIASEPWLERKNSSWWYPWDEEWKLEVLDTGCAGQVVNTAA